MKFFKNLKIRRKIIVAFLFITIGALLMAYLGIFVISRNLRVYVEDLYKNVTGNALEYADDALLSQAENSLKTLVTVQQTATNNSLAAISSIVDQASDYAEALYSDPDKERDYFDVVHLSKAPGDSVSLRYMLSTGVEMTDAIRDEIKLLSNTQEMFEPVMKYNPAIDDLYIGTASGIFFQYTNSNVYHSDYIVTQRSWYLAACENPDKVVWMETHVDSYGKACLTISKAIQSKDGKILGVAAADVPFDDLMGQIIKDTLGKSGQSFILGKSYDIIAFKGVDFKEFDPAFEKHFKDPETVKKNLATGSEDAFFATLDGEEIYMMCATIPETGWTFCTAINKDEILSPIKTVTAQTQNIISQSSKELVSVFRYMIISIVIVFIFVGISVAVIAYFLAKSITKPLNHLSEQVANIGDGNFDMRIAPESKDEIGDLAEKFNEMQISLGRYMQNLRTVTAEREKIGAELGVATQIQADMLPRIFPPFPERNDISLYASMNPAKEVGGDFYDFFMIDDDHLAIVIADVSGKGVPAALFMVISKTTIQNRAMQGGTPAEILEDVNKRLCVGNEAEMFVTCWLGICELSTGKIIAANAGHEFPAVCKADKHFELLKDKHGFVLAGMETAKYKNYEFALEKDGGLFVYTDGVPEATNSYNELFGTERMLDALNSSKGKQPEDLLKNVSDKAFEFTGDAPQFDDLTMVGFMWHGSDSKKTGGTSISLKADTAELSKLNTFLEEQLEQHNCPMGVLMQIQVSSEEIFTNISHYAYKGSTGTADISIDFIKSEDGGADTMRLEFADSGTPFDPLKKADPDITLSAEDRVPGGLGIFMVKKSMDKVEYKYEDQKNILTLYKKLENKKK